MLLAEKLLHLSKMLDFGIFFFFVFKMSSFCKFDQNSNFNFTLNNAGKNILKNNKYYALFKCIF